MLQVIRDKSQGFLAWAIILLIAGIFAVLGITDYLNSRSSSTEAALVNGEPISWKSVDRLYQRVLQEQTIPVGSEQAVKAQIVAGLAQQRALFLGLKSQGFMMSPEQVIHFLKKNPAFEVDGQFSKEQFKTLIAHAGYNENEFVQEFSQDLLRNQVVDGLSLSALPVKQELARAVQLLEQTRDFGYVVIPATQYRAEVSPLISEEEIQQYYESHLSQFISPEQVAIDYIELSMNDLMAKMPVTESDLKTFYEENPGLFSKSEQIHARHILISTMNKSPEEAKAAADSILAKLKQGEDFATLAKAESQDTMSAQEGGDLKWFGRGAMVPEFEQAAFALKNPGDIAGPVQTNYGYHIIQLVARRDPEKRSFADSKALVEEHYRKTKAESKFEHIKDQWIKLRRETEKDLAPIATALELPIKTTKLFERQNNPKTLEAEATLSPEIRQAAFSPDVLKETKNSALITINDVNNPQNKHLAMIHLTKHQSAHQQTLEEARATILERLSLEKSAQKAKQLGDTLVSQLKAGKQQEADKILEDLSKTHHNPWIQKTNITRANQEIDSAFIREAFHLPMPNTTTEHPSVTGFELPNGDYVVLAVTKLKLGDMNKMDAGTKTAYQKSMDNMNHQIEFGSYLNEIFTHTKVKFFEMPED